MIICMGADIGMRHNQKIYHIARTVPIELRQKIEVGIYTPHSKFVITTNYGYDWVAILYMVMKDN